MSEGAYEILEKLGDGTMASVFVARRSDLPAEVALKVLRSDLLVGQDFLRRLESEARVIAGLDHPHLVMILEARWRKSRFYVAMERIEGPTLRELARRSPDEVRARADRTLVEILEALQVLHDAGLVHRDLRAENVMVREDGSSVLMECGLVRDLDSDGTQITPGGALLGSASSLAPEILGGSPATVATDLWAAGCLYFRLHAGRPPFEGDERAAVSAAIAAGNLSIDRACPHLDAARRGLLAELLATDPARRPASARAVADRLRAAPGAASAGVTEVASAGEMPRASGSRVAPSLRSLRLSSGAPSSVMRSREMEAVREVVRSIPPRAGGLFVLFVTAMALGGLTVFGPGGGAEQAPQVAASGLPGLEEQLGTVLFQLRPAAWYQDFRRQMDGLPLLDRAGKEARRQHANTVGQNLAAALDRNQLRRIVKRLASIRERTPCARDPDWKQKYDAVVDIQRLNGGLAELGKHLDLELDAAYPPDHRPLDKDPGWPGETFCLSFKKKYASDHQEKHRSWQEQVVVDDGLTHLLLWAKDSAFVPGQMAFALKRIDRAVAQDTSTYTHDVPLSLRPVRPDEVAMLVVGAEKLSSGQHLSVAFSPDRRTWSHPVNFVGRSLNFYLYRHILAPELLSGPQYVKFTYGDSGEMSYTRDIEIDFVFVHYLVRPLTSPLASPGAP